MTTETLSNDVTRFVLRMCEDLGTPVALGVYLRVKHRCWSEVATIKVVPQSYLTASAFLRDAQAASLLRKLRELPSGIDVEAVALQKWWEAERSCYLSNERLERYDTHRGTYLDDRCDPGISAFFADVQKLIRSWIGEGPPDLIEGRFGPGSTFSDRGHLITVPDKCSSDPTLTTDAVWFLPQWLGSQMGSALIGRQGKLEFVRGNRHTTVPKDASTDRNIAIEPAVNVFYQLGVGRLLRRRIHKSTGWDLLHAQDVHRQIARESSVTREFATLDLSNASDTLSTSLVKILMPAGWFSILSSLRSPFTQVKGKWVKLEKFSSMGNGFTFELETLIFMALACVVSRQCGYRGMPGVDVFVFGDDIIVKDDVVRPLSAVLNFAGFSVNQAKSFYGGIGFRESCGGDYFDGVEVRPHFLKELPSSPSEWISLANGYSRVMDRLALAGSPIARTAWFQILDQIPFDIRCCRGPKELGDIVIHDLPRSWTVRVRHSIRYVKAYRPHRHIIVKMDRFAPNSVLASATYGVRTVWQGQKQIYGVVPRDSVLSSKVGWVPYS